MSTAGSCRSTSNSVMPAVGLSHSSRGVVRTKSRHMSHMGALLVPHLGPGHHVGVAVSHCPGADGGGVCAGVGFGDAESDVQLARRDPGQHLRSEFR